MQIKFPWIILRMYLPESTSSTNLAQFTLFGSFGDAYAFIKVLIWAGVRSWKCSRVSPAAVRHRSNWVGVICPDLNGSKSWNQGFRGRRYVSARCRIRSIKASTGKLSPADLRSGSIRDDQSQRETCWPVLVSPISGLIPSFTLLWFFSATSSFTEFSASNHESIAWQNIL